MAIDAMIVVDTIAIVIVIARLVGEGLVHGTREILISSLQFEI